MIIFIQSMLIFASASTEQEQPNIVMAYETPDGFASVDTLFLESVFAGMTDQVHLMHIKQVTADTLKNADVMVFVGESKGKLPKEFITAINNFKGHLIVFGNNAEQLPQFEKWQFRGKQSLRTLDGKALLKVSNIIEVKPPKDSDVIVGGADLNTIYPVIVKDGRTSYIAKTSFRSEDRYILSRELYRLLDIQPPATHMAYIRLEDISPNSDPKLVKETGEYLAEKGIPFYMAVTPVYVKSETGEQLQLKDNKKLVKVLRNLQKSGGMVIAHGYTHTYRYTEKGTDFEFWDAINDQKIASVNPEEAPKTVKNRADFTTEKEYEQHLKKIDAIERRYIEDKMNLSIEKLTEVRLYPISFEAPQYAMSSTGYEVIAEQFTSTFGQIQLSNDTHKIMGSPLKIGKPALLEGMTLYPETIGYIDPSKSNPLEDMEKAIKKVQEVPGAVIGGFYHTYLGVEYLPNMVRLMETVPNLEWLDLRKTTQTVQSEKVVIQQKPNEELQVTSQINWTDKIQQRLKERPFEMVLWILAIVVALFVTAFFMYVVRLRAKLRKRLFEERNFNG
ncbi:DUF2334 domain-containing protein [Viridibacillus sp. YIM B01967]|uniref:DUF2334 domain-containing protein n=1 Tax=Viridibacillus soli TaxID=2798301 RepID=A0ABS1H5Q0_9BACL|nr:DUF2334 domain-containing protein [Viridibacillus soli]